MSLPHFFDINKVRINEDLHLINENNIDERVIPNTVNRLESVQFIHSLFDTSLDLKNYWIFRINLYFDSINLLDYPLCSETNNLNNIDSLDAYNLECCTVVDYLKFYFTTGYIVFKIKSEINMTYSDGLNIEFVWELVYDEQNLLQHFTELISQDGICQILANENELFRVLYENNQFENFSEKFNLVENDLNNTFNNMEIT